MGQEWAQWTRRLDLRAVGSATLGVSSWLASGASTAAIEIRVAGGAWEVLTAVPVSGGWLRLDVDLGAYAGEVVELRFVFDAVAPAESASPDVWRLDEVWVTAWGLAER